MKYFKKLQEMDRRMRELAGLYAAEKERADSLAEELRAFLEKQTCKESLQGGNAAKMRDALKYLRDASREFCHLILNSKHNEIYDKYKSKEVSKISDAIVNANFILAAPARNCDVYQTKDSLLKAIHDDRGYLQDPIKERKSVVDFVLAEAADVKQNLTTAEAKGGEK